MDSTLSRRKARPVVRVEAPNDRLPIFFALRITSCYYWEPTRILQSPYSSLSPRS